MAESVIGLYKTEVIAQRGPWHNLRDVEFAKLEWVNWFNNSRLLGAIGNIPHLKLWGKVLQSPGDPSRCGWTQIKKPPEKPGRFKCYDTVEQGKMGHEK